MNPLIELAKLSPNSPHFRAQVRDGVEEVKLRYKDQPDIVTACNVVLSTPHRESCETWKRVVRDLCQRIIDFELG